MKSSKGSFKYGGLFNQTSAQVSAIELSREEVSNA